MEITIWLDVVDGKQNEVFNKLRKTIEDAIKSDSRVFDYTVEKR